MSKKSKLRGLDILTGVDLQDKDSLSRMIEPFDYSDFSMDKKLKLRGLDIIKYLSMFDRDSLGRMIEQLGYSDFSSAVTPDAIRADDHRLLMQVAESTHVYGLGFALTAATEILCDEAPLVAGQFIKAAKLAEAKGNHGVARLFSNADRMATIMLLPS
jgi:hypothetical protein